MLLWVLSFVRSLISGCSARMCLMISGSLFCAVLGLLVVAFQIIKDKLAPAFHVWIVLFALSQREQGT